MFPELVRFADAGERGAAWRYVISDLLASLLSAGIIAIGLALFLGEAIGLTVILLSGAAWCVAFWFTRRRLRRSLRARLRDHEVAICLECGYDLTGNASGRCPECGAAVT